MNNLLRGSIHHLASLAGAILLCWGAISIAEEFDIRNLNLDDYTYPGSEVIDKRQDQYYATMELLSRDSSADIVTFYESIGLKVQAAEDRSASGYVVPAGRIVFENQMVAAHVPLSVWVDTDGSQSHSLNDNDLFHKLEVYVATGVRKQSDLDTARENFDGLKQKFYKSSPSSMLSDCQSSISEAQEESMEDRARRMQELAMQGRMDELRKEMEGFTGQTSSIEAVAGDKWDEEIECLRKLKNESYPVLIKVVADRDDLLG